MRINPVLHPSSHGVLRNIAQKASWNYETNNVDENSQVSQEAFQAKAFEIASQFDTTGLSYDTTRQLSKVGSKSLRDEEMEELRKFKKKKSLEEETAKKSEEERLDKNRVKQKKYELSIIYTMICL